MTVNGGCMLAARVARLIYFFQIFFQLVGGRDRPGRPGGRAGRAGRADSQRRRPLPRRVAVRVHIVASTMQTVGCSICDDRPGVLNRVCRHADRWSQTRSLTAGRHTSATDDVLEPSPAGVEWPHQRQPHLPWSSCHTTRVIDRAMMHGAGLISRIFGTGGQPRV